MYSRRVQEQALAHLTTGATLSEVSRATGVSRATLRSWREQGPRQDRGTCPACDGADLVRTAYAAVLGYYLGDGHVSRAARYFALRITCDATYPAIIEDVVDVVTQVHPGRQVFRVPAPGCVVVQSHWMHWPCLFPQHGPGRKHERPIVLEDWQRDIVEEHPAAFLRGLFHSDGSRVRNWATRVVAGERKRYDYPRWQFTNVSSDIRELCCWALDLAGVAWRRSNHKTISVSRRADVARLDDLVGPKG
ncbi:transposase [Nocardioides sp. MAHUQ-72]|uniref:transposase n=1 Tax=unclassified Nocardioides TaxID=2615069 RepID=UPI0036162385